MILKMTALRHSFMTGLFLVPVLMLGPALLLSRTSSAGALVITLIIALFLMAAYRSYRERHAHLLLADDGLRNHRGELLVGYDEIERVHRGLFALRPAQGLAISLRTPHQAAFVPGLYWRFGRRIGIGGATQPGSTRAFAEHIEAARRAYKSRQTAA